MTGNGSASSRNGGIVDFHKSMVACDALMVTQDAPMDTRDALILSSDHMMVACCCLAVAIIQ